ncbi:MAG: hypothetical protein MMC23_001208 [Stictis urceolatum]|nr:hypothetical protein [Stictis urceolata]
MATYDVEAMLVLVEKICKKILEHEMDRGENPSGILPDIQILDNTDRQTAKILEKTDLYSPEYPLRFNAIKLMNEEYYHENADEVRSYQSWVWQQEHQIMAVRGSKNELDEVLFTPGPREASVGSSSSVGSRSVSSWRNGSSNSSGSSSDNDRKGGPFGVPASRVLCALEAKGHGAIADVPGATTTVCYCSLVGVDAPFDMGYILLGQLLAYYRSALDHKRQVSQILIAPQDIELATDNTNKDNKLKGILTLIEAV